MKTQRWLDEFAEKNPLANNVIREDERRVTADKFVTLLLAATRDGIELTDEFIRNVGENLKNVSF